MKLFSYEAWGIDPTTGFDPNKNFVRSHFVSPTVLGSIRALLSIYSFTAIITCYVWLAYNTATLSLKDVNIGSYTIQQSDAAIGQSFSFFTYLTFWSLGFYFLVSSVHTFVYAFRQQTWLHKWPKALQLAHSLYYSTVTSFPFLVTIVFWGTMNSGWPAGRFEQWMNLSVHGLNSVFAITEMVLPATEAPPISHLSVVLLVLSVYLGLSYLTRYTQGFYVYEWMNPKYGNGSIILHVLGYAAGMIAIFFIVRYAITGRNMLAAKLEARRDHGLRDKSVRFENQSDTWSATVEVDKSVRAKGSKGFASQV